MTESKVLLQFTFTTILYITGELSFLPTSLWGESDSIGNLIFLLLSSYTTNI